MTLEVLRERLEAKNYIFFYVEPKDFDHYMMARLLINLDDPDKAKRLIFYWVFISQDCQKKFKPEVIRLLEATGRIVDRCGGKWFSNLWQLIDFTKGLYERHED